MEDLCAGFDPSRNCMDLVLAVLSLHGVDVDVSRAPRVPLQWQGVSHDQAVAVHDAFDAHLDGWLEVDPSDVQMLDVLEARLLGRLHIGIAVAENCLLHKPTRHIRIEPWKDPQWTSESRFRGWFRHPALA